MKGPCRSVPSPKGAGDHTDRSAARKRGIAVPRLAFAGAMACGIAACAGHPGLENPYQTYYFPVDYAGTLAKPEPFSGQPQLSQSSGDYDRDVGAMYAKGLIPVGISQFAGSAPAASEATAQALRVKAAVVLVFSPPRSPASGASGYSICRHSALDICDQNAVFYAPLSKAGLGAEVYDVPVEVSKRAGTNSGAYITVVRPQSPASAADLRPGDVILTVAGQSVSVSSHTYRYAITAAVGKPTDFLIWRDGQRLSKTITIPVAW
jgi:hypothetical protein